MPWNDWYHLMTHTYGTWLPGDAKGFRTRHHREHIDGDYKNPPPAGQDFARFEKAKSLMKREAVHLNVAQRQRAVDEIVRSFSKRQIEIKALCIDGIHLHLLSRIVDHNPRHHLGVAKRECSHYMKVEGLAPVGGLWGVRCEVVPIVDERHFANVDDYILDHHNRGAAVWPVGADAMIPNNAMDDFDPNGLVLD